MILMKLAAGLIAPLVASSILAVIPLRNWEHTARGSGREASSFDRAGESRIETGQSTQSAAATPYRDQVISVNGVRIHYLDWGVKGKQPLVILHESSRFAHSYDHIAAQFNREYYVIAVDLRGHGDSEWSPTGAYFVADYVKDIEALVEQLQLRNIVLLSASLGGRVAQMYTGLHPDRVARLIVEDVGPERGPEIRPLNLRMVKEEEAGWASEDDLLARLKNGEGRRIADSLHREFIRYGTKRRADGRLILKRDPNYVNGLVTGDVWQYVRKITCPALYIVGTDSNIVPQKTRQELKATGPNFQVVEMPGIGHYPHLEAADAYVAIIKNFLSKPAKKPSAGW